MKIVITGGHLTPALALIEKLPKDWEILFIGRRHALEGQETSSLEYETVTKMGIRFEDVGAGRLQRRLTRHTIPSLLRIPASYPKAYKLISEFKPDVAVGFGGYISVPVLLIAKLLGIPAVIHEQTLKPGMSNKLLSAFVDKVCVSWNQSLSLFPKHKTVLTGNPVRKNIFNKIDLPSGSDPLLFVTGGSTGSHFINSLVEKTLDSLLKSFRIIHQTGDSAFKDYERLSKNHNSKYIVLKNIGPSSMGFVFQNSSVVVSRAGINTVTELLEFSKPAILIPLPSGQKDEQERNARFLEDLGLAKVLEQSSVSPQSFIDTITQAYSNIGDFKLKNEEGLVADAADRLLKVIKDVADQKDKKEK